MKQVLTVSYHEFDGSTADIHRKRGLVCHRHAVLDPEEDEPGLLRPADHADDEAGLFFHQVDEFPSVPRFPDCTGGDGNHAVIPFVLRQRYQMAKHAESPRDGILRKAVRGERAVAEPGHVLEAVEELVAE